MVKVTYEQKPFRREVMRTYGAAVTPSPSDTTERRPEPFSQEHPGYHRQPGLRHLRGCGSRRQPAPATAMCWAASLTRCCCTSPSSVWRPRRPWTSTASVPDIIIGCAGGGSNLGGLISPFMGEKLRGERGLPVHRRGARLLPQLHPRQVRHTISVTPARSARWPRCTPWAAASFPPPTTPEVCGTTA